MQSGRIIAVIGLIVGSFLYAPTCFAWGKFGHLTVCDLAYRNLTDPAKQALKGLMHSDEGGIAVKGRGRMPDRKYTSFNAGCIEEDEIPRKHPDDHYLNVSRDTTAIKSGACPGGESCILAGIQRDFEVLRDTSKTDEERVFALMALGHWIGDIHQPLHVSFDDDRGGNYIAVQLKHGARCGTVGGAKPKKLHALWDNCLLESLLFERVRQRNDYKPTWGKRTITYRAVDTLQANTTLSDEQSLVVGDPWTWAAESFVITLQPGVGYCVQKGDECHYSDTSETYQEANLRTQVVDTPYLQKYALVAQEQVRRAGFRLADLINQALDPAYARPIANSTQRP